MKYGIIYLLLLFSSVVMAEIGTEKKSIHIILSSGDAIYYDIAESIKSALSKTELPPHEINVMTLESDHLKVIEFDDLLIPIGAKAAEEVHSYQSTNAIVYSFVEQELIHDLNPNKLSEQWVAVTVNQPIERLILLADKLVKNNYKNKIIVVVSKDNVDLIDTINAIDPLDKGHIEIIEIDKKEFVTKVVEKSLFNAAALISTDESAIWSGSNAKWLLRQAYNHHVPVVGNSKRFLKAGALVSVYSSMGGISARTSILIKQWLEGGLRERGIQAVQATVDINKNVAHALNYNKNRLQLLEANE